MTSVNIFTAEMEYDEEDPAGYNAAVSNVGKQAGGDELAVKLFDVPAGQSLCPYHYEYVEEWLLVLEGEVVVRVPDGERRLAARRPDVLRTRARRRPQGLEHRAADRSGADVLERPRRWLSPCIPTATRSASGPATPTTS